MKILEHFKDFFEVIREDQRITPTHISVYMAILNEYLTHKRQNPIKISRKAIMLNAKISANATYYKSLKELNSFRYIRYTPSYISSLSSVVYLRRI